MSQPGSSSDQPTSYKTNVNRAKTKRWVEAKSYSYDGDDWGEVDDYDEYGGYDEPEPEPAPASRPTGLRQRGQSASHGSTDPYAAIPQPMRPSYGEQRPSNVQPVQGNRSVTNPVPPTQPGVHRQNSFDREDDRRALSGSQPTELAHATGRRAPQLEPQSVNAPVPLAASAANRANVPPPRQTPSTYSPQPMPFRRNPDEQVHSPGQPQPQRSEFKGPPLNIQQGPFLGTGGRTQSMTSNASADVQGRREIPPQLAMQPQPMRGSPSPHSIVDGRHPPRKSSLGQDNAPSPSFINQASLVTSPTDASGAVRNQRDRSTSGTDKSLPFVRPADIYRRMEEEREKERRSQESTRPSLDSIVGKPRERLSIDTRRDSDGGQRSKAALDPVQEWKNEHSPEATKQPAEQHTKETTTGPTNMAQSEATSGPVDQSERRISQQTIDSESSSAPANKKTTSKTFEIQRPSGSASTQSSLGPRLPEVSRISGFGDAFGESFMGSSSGFGDFSVSLEKPSISKPDPATKPTSEGVPDSHADRSKIQEPPNALTHQPSLGFKSAVHQSFDRAQEQVPPTPSSTAGSSIERSTSGGTSAVSPIISRGPSNAMQPLPGIEDVSTSNEQSAERAFAERPTSSSSMGTLTQSRSITQTVPPLAEATESVPPPSFIPGHRRDMSTPSPDNSPARTPVLEANRQLRKPQEIEFATTTPTPTDTEPESEIGLNERRNTEGSGYLEQDKQTSAAGPSFYVTPSQDEQLQDARPTTDRMESFRPQIPGGWQSSTSIATAVPRGSGRIEHMRPGLETPKPSQPDLTLGADQSDSFSVEAEGPTHQKTSDVSTGAFAAAASAGSALAGALVAAVGGNQVLTKDDPNEGNARSETPSSDWSSGSSNEAPAEQVAFHPRPLSIPKPLALDQKMSPTAPTPSHKDTSGALQKGTFQDYSSHVENDGNLVAAPPSQSDSSRSKQQQALPNLSTNVQEHRYESDRLRREIVKELTPSVASEPTTAESDSPYPTSSKYSTTQSGGPRSGHESGTIPREYDSYWHGDPHLSNPSSAQPEHNEKIPSIQQPPPPVAEDDEGASRVPVPAPGSDLPSEISKSLPTPSQTLSHRFSWEQPLEELASSNRAADEHTVIDGPEAHEQSLAPTQQTHLPESTTSDYPETARSSTIVETSTLGLNDSIRKPPKLREEDEEQLDETPGVHAPGAATEKELPSYPEDFERSQYLPEIAGAVATPPSLSTAPEPLGASSQTKDQDQNSTSTPPQSAYQEKQQVQVAEDMQKPQGSPTAVVANASQPKIPPFREILALKSPSERIHAYNETRQKFANLDTGLMQWLVATTTDLSEHADLLSSQGRSATLQAHQSSPSRSKLGGINPSGPDMSGASPSGPSQVYASQGGSSSRKSSQQVQAKSKEFLHSAGVFGGKANVAAKGLFSKGKSKLRGSGADKAPSPAPRAIPDPTFRGMQFTPENTNPDSRPPNQDHSVPVGSRPTSINLAQGTSNQRLEKLSESRGNTPSTLESNSQGRLADDERSEESIEMPRESRPLPPRSSSLHNVDRIVDQHALPVTKQGSSDPDRIDTSDKIRLVSNHSTPKQKPSPRSTQSSNRTPTQTTYQQDDRDCDRDPDPDDHNQYCRRPSSTSGPSGAQYVANRSESPVAISATAPALPHLPSASAPPKHLSSNPKSSSYSPSRSRSADIPASPDHEDRGDNVDNSIRKIDDTEESGGVPLVKLPQGTTADSTSMPRKVRGSYTAQVPPPPPPPTVINALEPPSPRPSPFSDAPPSRLNPTRFFRRHAPSIGSIPSAIDPERPPSPVSPYNPTPNPYQQQARSVIPVHHGISHDFKSNQSFDSGRRESPSLNRPLQPSRPSQESHEDQVSLQDHPAFRQSSEIDPARENAVNHHPGIVSRGEHPMQSRQAPHYQLDHLGTPDLPPVDTNSGSRRSSRSSTFFRNSSRSPARNHQPSPKNATKQQQASPPANGVEGARTKRSSLLSRIKGSSGSTSDRTRGKESVIPRSATLPVHKVNVESQRQTGDSVPGTQHPSPAARLSQKLQRASTSGTPTRDDGKKKRLSTLGSLFSRSGQKRQSFASQAFSSPAQGSPSSNQYNTAHASQPVATRFPLEEEPGKVKVQPPLEGYYAPKHAQRPRPHMARQSNVSAYYQTSSQHQTMTPMTDKASPVATRTSQPANTQSLNPATHREEENIEGTPGQHQSTSSSRPGGAWARFAAASRPDNKLPSAAPPPNSMASLSHINDFISSPPPAKSSRPTSRTWVEGNIPPPPEHVRRGQTSHTEPENTQRPESPAPPPPPPKDEWHQPRQSRHGRPASQPLNIVDTALGRPPADRVENRYTTMVDQRPILPPLQTDVPSPSLRMTKFFSDSPDASGSASASTARASRYGGNAGVVITNGTPTTAVLASTNETTPATRSAGRRSETVRSMDKPLSPEEKRLSRREEIEKGHLRSSTHTTPTSTTTSTDQGLRSATGSGSGESKKRSKRRKPPPQVPPLQTQLASPAQGIAQPPMQIPRRAPSQKSEQPPAEIVAPRTRTAERSSRYLPERREESSEDEIVMSATSFPGQEWQPPEFLHWEGE